MGFATQQKELNIKQIVLETIKKLGEISSFEFRGGFMQKKISGNLIEEIYVEDSRKKFIQVIEFLVSLVKPKFDKTMKETHERLMKEQENNYNLYANKDNEVYTINKLKIMRELFDEVNLFFERANYFKGEYYTEGDDDDFEEDEV